MTSFLDHPPVSSPSWEPLSQAAGNVPLLLTTRPWSTSTPTWLRRGLRIHLRTQKQVDGPRDEPLSTGPWWKPLLQSIVVKKVLTEPTWANPRPKKTVHVVTIITTTITDVTIRDTPVHRHLSPLEHHLLPNRSWVTVEGRLTCPLTYPTTKVVIPEQQLKLKYALTICVEYKNFGHP